MLPDGKKQNQGDDLIRQREIEGRKGIREELPIHVVFAPGRFLEEALRDRPGVFVEGHQSTLGPAHLLAEELFEFGGLLFVEDRFFGITGPTAFRGEIDT